MSFDGPAERDFENVASLNSAYLAMLGTEPVLRRGLAVCSDSVGRRLASLTRDECRWLAETPLLLFSFRERDDRYWDAVLGESTEPGLFRSSGSESVDTLVAAALGFVWQLASQNPYTLRIICGATLYWCERIAAQTFFGLLDAVRNAGDIPALRHAHSEALWKKLLDAGISPHRKIRRAAQLAALQSVLTDPAPGSAASSWPLAARQVDPAGLRVAEIRERTKR